MLPEKLEMEEKYKKDYKKINLFKRFYLNIKNIIINFPYALFGVLIFVVFLFIVTHEATHGVVFDEYGCKNITYSANFSGFFTEANCTTLSVERRNQLDMVQSLEEVIQYPMAMFLVFIVFIALKKP